MSIRLRIAIVHYHLRAGGVTRVITNAAKALAEKGHQVAIFAGDIPRNFEAPQDVSLQRVSGLDYTFAYSQSSVDALDEEFRRAASDVFGASPDVWHFHNHSLGKNLNLPPLVERWAQEGRAMLLQIHDFAENGRPENYALLLKAAGKRNQLREMLYPSSSRIHYCALNHRDLKILQDAGAGNRASVLPNPIEIIPDTAEEFPAARLNANAFTLYPCRPLGRKNIGEALLWSFYFESGQKLVLPVAPESPAERKGYEAWKSSAAALRLPVEFEVMERFGCSLESLMAASRQVLTTSIMEGFGMAFLEPWLMNKSLVGRNLPEVTADFSAEGVNLDHLYQGLPIPVEWIGRERILRSLDLAVKSLGAAYQTDIPDEWTEALKDGIRKNDLMDFGFLNDAFQREVLHSITHSGEMKKEISFGLLRQSEFVKKNSAAVRENYSSRCYMERVEHLYFDLAGAAASAVHALDGDAILQSNVRNGLAMALRTAPLKDH